MVSGQIQATIGKPDCDIVLFIAGVSVNISNKKPPERSCEGEKKEKERERYFPGCKLHDTATL